MRRYTGDPADKPTVVRKLNEKALLPTKKMKLEKDGKYKVFNLYIQYIRRIGTSI